jgi:hypothetical protein
MALTIDQDAKGGELWLRELPAHGCSTIVAFTEKTN